MACIVQRSGDHAQSSCHCLIPAPSQSCKRTIKGIPLRTISYFMEFTPILGKPLEHHYTGAWTSVSLSQYRSFEVVRFIVVAVFFKIFILKSCEQTSFMTTPSFIENDCNSDYAMQYIIILFIFIIVGCDIR